MSLCPVCGEIICNHTPEERDQTIYEMVRPLNAKEHNIFLDCPRGAKQLILLAQENAHRV